MMICPASYVELELKGKSPEVICAKIRGLQREILFFKNHDCFDKIYMLVLNIRT